MNSWRFMNNPSFGLRLWTFSGFRSGLALCGVRSTLSKPATKIFLFASAYSVIQGIRELCRLARILAMKRYFGADKGHLS